MHDREDATLASGLIREACHLEGISNDQIILHSDNGSPMKDATMLATLQQLGVMPSLFVTMLGAVNLCLDQPLHRVHPVPPTGVNFRSSLDLSRCLT